MSGYVQHAFFDFLVPSNIFNIAVHHHLQTAHNRSIAALTHPYKLRYTAKLEKIVRVITNPEIADYQSALLQQAINGISADRVDIDQFCIELKLTEKDIEHIFDSEEGILNVRSGARRARLTVKKLFVGNRNNGFKKQDSRPFFTHRFSMIMDGDDYRSIDLFYACADHPRNKGRALRYNFEVEFIPTHLTQAQISLMFFHLKSVLHTNRYNQLIRLATIGRIDTGYTMYGVSQLFAFISTKNKNAKVGTSFPKNKEHAVETTYIGDRQYHHLIAYDKVLKENKVFVEAVFSGLPVKFSEIAAKLEGVNQWFPNQACSFRIESRQFFSKTDEHPRLAEMELIRSRLEDLEIVQPRYIKSCTETRVKNLIRSKTLCQTRPLIEELEQSFCIQSPTFSFNQSAIRESFFERISTFKEILLNPSLTINEAPLVNYSQAVLDARKSILPFIHARKSDDDSNTSIVQCKASAIYVEGCPGAGKTRLIVARVKALLKQGVPASDIAVLAYTKDAVKEFKKRLVRSELYSERMFVGTFSSWAKSIIDDDGLKSHILDDDRYLEVLTNLVSSTPKLINGRDPEEVAKRLKSIFSHAANFETPDIKRTLLKLMPDMETHLLDILKVHKKLTKFKNDNGLRDFSDLFSVFNKKLKDKVFISKVTGKFKYLVLDEIQDTNLAQWGIIKTLHSDGMHLFCVGDPAQSMYGFRGASDINLRQFLKVFPEGKKFYKSANYRSTGALVSLCNIIRTKINNNYSSSISKLSEGLKPQAKICDDLGEAAHWIVNDYISRSSDIDKTTVLILCRYRAQVDKIISVLNDFDVNLGKGSVVKVLTYHGAKGLEAKLCYVVDPLFSYSRLSSYKEELCNTYVAFTRAEEELIVIQSSGGLGFYGVASNRYGKPSKWKDFKSENMFAILLKDNVELID